MDTSSTDSRQVGKHLFIFQKDENYHSNSPTIIAKPVEVIEELPQEFVKCLKTLFDILDEKGSGLVKLSDIEARWGGKEGYTNNFPVAVIENLKKVAPRSGLLSFERLCTGMKLAMKNNAENFPNTHSSSLRSSLVATESRNRSQSMPHLENHFVQKQDLSWDKEVIKPSRKDKVAVMDKLKNWQRESLRKRNSASDTCLMGGHKSYATTGSSPCEKPVVHAKPIAKVFFVGKEESLSPQTNCLPSNRNTDSDVSPGKIKATQSTKHINSLHSPTIQKCDTNLHKDSRLVQLDDELLVLQRGLELIENARKWYFKRITAIQEEKLHLKQMEKYSLEQFQYEVLLHKTRRKELQLEEESFSRYRSYIEDLNRCLKQVSDNPSQPLIGNAANSNSDKSNSLKQELQKELLQKNAKITQLENEKSALIQKLFQRKPVNSAPSPTQSLATTD